MKQLLRWATWKMMPMADDLIWTPLPVDPHCRLHDAIGEAKFLDSDAPVTKHWAVMTELWAATRYAKPYAEARERQGDHVR